MIVQPQDFWAFGLHLRSSIAIPGAVPLLEQGAPVILVIRRSGPLPNPADWSQCPYELTRNGFVFTMPGLARYHCDVAGTIEVEAPDEAREEDLSAMLVATALPALLWARGQFVLHAAAAVFPGTSGAVAIAGPSGSGKSTWLARAIDNGAAMIADDSFCFDPAERDPSISGLCGGYFEADRRSLARRFMAVPQARQSRGALLAAIIVLGPPNQPIRRLGSLDALEGLLRHRHRPSIARLLGRDAAQLVQLTALSKRLPIFQMTAEHLRNYSPLPCEIGRL